MSLSREEDFHTTGNKHDFVIDYEAEGDEDGRILSLKYRAYINGENVFLGEKEWFAVKSFACVYRVLYQVPIKLFQEI